MSGLQQGVLELLVELGKRLPRQLVRCCLLEQRILPTTELVPACLQLPLLLGQKGA